MIRYNAERNFQSGLAELHWVYIKQNSRYWVSQSLILTVLAGISEDCQDGICAV